MVIAFFVVFVFVVFVLVVLGMHAIVVLGVQLLVAKGIVLCLSFGFQGVAGLTPGVLQDQFFREAFLLDMANFCSVVRA